MERYIARSFMIANVTAALSFPAIVIWILGIPGKGPATAWGVGFFAFLGFPVVWALLGLYGYVWNRFFASGDDERVGVQFRIAILSNVAVVALVCCIISVLVLRFH